MYWDILGSPCNHQQMFWRVFKNHPQLSMPACLMSLAQTKKRRNANILQQFWPVQLPVMFQEDLCYCSWFTCGSAGGGMAVHRLHLCEIISEQYTTENFQHGEPYSPIPRTGTTCHAMSCRNATSARLCRFQVTCEDAVNNGIFRPWHRTKCMSSICGYVHHVYKKNHHFLG